jgi:hypothetical protein
MTRSHRARRGRNVLKEGHLGFPVPSGIASVQVKKRTAGAWSSGSPLPSPGPRRLSGSRWDSSLNYRQLPDQLLSEEGVDKHHGKERPLPGIGFPHHRNGLGAFAPPSWRGPLPPYGTIRSRVPRSASIPRLARGSKEALARVCRHEFGPYQPTRRQGRLDASKNIQVASVQESPSSAKIFADRCWRRGAPSAGRAEALTTVESHEPSPKAWKKRRLATA